MITVNVHLRPRFTVEAKRTDSGTTWVSIDDGTGSEVTIFVKTPDEAREIAAVFRTAANMLDTEPKSEVLTYTRV